MDAMTLLADSTRRRIIELLAEGELSAGEIAEHFETSRPAVSRHLRQLREAGLVSVTRSGQRQIYRLEPAPLIAIDEWLAPIRAFWGNRLDALDVELRRGSASARRPRTTRQAAQRQGKDSA